MAKILIIDDNQALCGIVDDCLTQDHHLVDVAYDGKDALNFLEQYPYDLILLDWGLPDIDGLELLKRLRNSDIDTPVLILTGRGEVSDKTTGLDSGADDYLTKPFDVQELRSRIRAILRRPPRTVKERISIGSVALDRATHTVTKCDNEVKLFRKEYLLLEFLMLNRGTVYSAEELLDHVWRSEAGVSPETVRTTVARLRKHLDNPGEESIIENVRGFGYKIRGD